MGEGKSYCFKGVSDGWQYERQGRPKKVEDERQSRQVEKARRGPPESEIRLEKIGGQVQGERQCHNGMHRAGKYHTS